MICVLIWLEVVWTGVEVGEAMVNEREYGDTCKERIVFLIRLLLLEEYTHNVITPERLAHRLEGSGGQPLRDHAAKMHGRLDGYSRKRCRQWPE